MRTHHVAQVKAASVALELLQDSFPSSMKCETTRAIEEATKQC